MHFILHYNQSSGTLKCDGDNIHVIAKVSLDRGLAIVAWVSFPSNGTCTCLGTAVLKRK